MAEGVKWYLLGLGNSERFAKEAAGTWDLGSEWQAAFVSSGRFEDLSFAKQLMDCTTARQLLQFLRAPPENLAGPSEQPSSIMAAVDAEAAKKAWKIPVIRSNQVSMYFVGTLKKYALEWKPEEWYAPMFAFVQSSGWGKSRLIHELWFDNIFVVYISCMGSKQSGHPARTELLADIIESNQSSESDIVALVLAALSTLNRSGCSPKEWRDGQESGGLCRDIYTEYLQLKDALAAAAPEQPDMRASDAVLTAALTHYYDRCSILYGGKYKEQLDKVPEKAMVLLCVDEAGELKRKAFSRFRRALTYVPATGSMVLSTDRKVADLAGGYNEYPSARVRNIRQMNQLFHPVCLVGQSDIFVSSSNSVGDRAAQVLRYGRPLWAAYYDSVASQDKVTATINLARKKLLGGEVEIVPKQQLLRGEGGEGQEVPAWLTRDVAVAVFAALIGVDVVAWGTLPQELAARHMRSIIRISQDRKRVFTVAAAEPALAAAAAQLLHMHEDAYLEDFLSRLIQVCVDGLVLEGVRGEMVARIVLILAMHQLTKDKNYIKPVSMKDFFFKLFGDDIVRQLEDNCCRLDVELFFNCFLTTMLGPSSKKLDEYFDRCAAMVSRRNEPVVDFTVPAKGTISGSAPTRTNPPRQVKKAKITTTGFQVQMSITGQVKNRKEDGCVTEAVERLDADDRSNQVVSVLFQVGSSNNKVEVSDTVVVVYGLDFARSFLGKRVVDRLKQLASTHVDVLRDRKGPWLKVCSHLLIGIRMMRKKQLPLLK